MASADRAVFSEPEWDDELCEEGDGVTTGVEFEVEPV